MAAPPTHVPFVDLGPSNRVVKERVLAAVEGLIDAGSFVNGPSVEAFEEAYAAACGRRRCVGLASGLDALRLALCALDLQPGDEVIVPAMTFVATFEAVVQAGGSPVVVDVQADDVTIDQDAAASACGPRTRAVVPVHLYGQMADMGSLLTLAERHRLFVLEDACQAHGAERDGLRAGAVGDAAAFSFYPTKNLGAMGDAGALVTDDEALARTVRALRQHGEVDKYRSHQIGYTARLDAIQAEVLRCKLPELERWNAERSAAAGRYSAALAGVGDLRLPAAVPGSVHVWHVYAVRTQRPEELANFLRARGLGTGRHYPEPPHLSRAFAHLGHEAGSFPVAEAVARETLSLPLFPGITERQQELVVEAVSAYFARG